MSETAQPAVFDLPPKLDHDGLRDLAEFVANRRGTPVTIDGAASAGLGALAAQILAAAALAWSQDRVAFAVADPNGTVAASLAQLGLADVAADVAADRGGDTEDDAEAAA